MPAAATSLRTVAIEVTNQCSKACWFCYNRSAPDGRTSWSADDVVAFGGDLAANGVRALAIGGGEPLEFGGLVEVIAGLSPRMAVTVTSSGLLLTNAMLQRLAGAGLRKVTLSIHFPEKAHEVERIAQQYAKAEAAGIPAAVNLLVPQSRLVAARGAVATLRKASIPLERITLLPMRQRDTPTPKEIAWVVEEQPFQSMACLCKCGATAGFATVAADRTAAWCAFTESRRRLRALTFAALAEALDGLEVAFCGGTEQQR